jgi:phosphatidylglycerol lysyltransferase
VSNRIGGAQTARASAHARVLELLRQHGWNATSFQVLEPGFSYWFAADACVAYFDTGRAWVAAGAPIAAEASLGSVASSFVAAARAAGRRACFFATEQRFLAVAGFRHLLIGEQPVWEPGRWSETLRATPSLREQLRRARAKGVSVSQVSAQELSDPRAPLRRQIEALVASWQRSKAMPPMGFLVHIEPFAFADERQVFVARLATDAGATVIGLAAAVPIYARQGWFLEDLIRAPGAPNGTTELLVDAVMSAVARLGSGYLTLGLSPLAGDVAPALGFARRYATPLYDFAGLRGFKAKLRPSSWAPIYLSFPENASALGAVVEGLRAFSRRGLLRYGLEAVLRGPTIVVSALAWLLVPWTLMLALLDERWFPAVWVHCAWVGFDLALFAALVALARHFRAWLSRVVVSAVTIDAVLTLAQALLFNASRLLNFADALGLGVAVAAPAIASRILARAHARAAAAPVLTIRSGRIRPSLS